MFVRKVALDAITLPSLPSYVITFPSLPRCVIDPSFPGASRAALEDVLEALKDAAVGKHGSPPTRSDQNGDGNPQEGGSGSGPGGEPDAETRRNAVRALTELCEEVGVGRNSSVEERGGAGVNQEGNDGGDESSGRSGEISDDVSGKERSREISEHVSQKERSGERSREIPGHVSGKECSGDKSGRWSPVRLTLGDVEGVLSSLLAASEDYMVDNRGDVGSWSRMEALVGLERLTRLAARGSRGLPFLDSSGEIGYFAVFLYFALSVGQFRVLF